MEDLRRAREDRQQISLTADATSYLLEGMGGLEHMLANTEIDDLSDAIPGGRSGASNQDGAARLKLRAIRRALY